MSFRQEDEPLPKRDLMSYFLKLRNWDGEPPAPKISHWKSDGRISIVAATALKTNSVQWDGKHMGFDDINPNRVLWNLLDGKYDHDFGFKISEWVPQSLDEWNDL